MKRTKQILAMLLCAVLLVTGTVAVTVAYLTSTTEVVTNTFTVGKVEITLDEADVNEYGALLNTEGKEYEDGDTLAERVIENTYKLIPGHEYVKDPTITVDSESEDCYLFVKIQNDISTLEKAGDTTIAKQMEALGWTDENKNGIYVYKEIVSAEDTVKVFETFTLADDADFEDVVASDAIKVIACAVQSDGLEVEEAEAEVPSDFVIQ